MTERRMGAAVQGPLVAMGGANEETLMNRSGGTAGCPSAGRPAVATTRRHPRPHLCSLPLTPTANPAAYSCTCPPPGLQPPSSWFLSPRWLPPPGTPHADRNSCVPSPARCAGGRSPTHSRARWAACFYPQVLGGHMSYGAGVQ